MTEFNGDERKKFEFWILNFEFWIFELEMCKQQEKLWVFAMQRLIWAKITVVQILVRWHGLYLYLVHDIKPANHESCFPKIFFLV